MKPTDHEYINSVLGTDYKTDDDIDYLEISRRDDLPNDFIIAFKDKLSWYEVFRNTRITEGLLESLNGHLSLYYARMYNVAPLSPEWLLRQKNIDVILQALNYVPYSEDVLKEILDRKVINEEKKEDVRQSISYFQTLSEDFMGRNLSVLNVDSICISQTLSGDFIRKHADAFNDNQWAAISRYQRLDPETIDEFADRLDWNNLSLRQRLTDALLKKYRSRIIMPSVVDSWLYKDAEFKKKEVERTGIYECHDDYLIAYKGIRKDRRSVYHPARFTYEKGKTYETWCDCSKEGCSYGFNVAAKYNADYYSEGLTVPVKVRYEDVGRVVYYPDNLRCFKFEVLG